MADRTEKVYILFGSQTGNSEQAAEDVGKLIKEKCSPGSIAKLASTSEKIHIEPHVMQLDDFLELEHSPWTRLVIIVTSSYGVGMAPLGCYRFRDLCDAWLENDDHKGSLKGIKFLLCGLGDSKYTTFFENPTQIDKALHHVGAERVGPLGKADASGTGKEAQPEVIRAWIDQSWPHIAKVVVQKPLEESALKTMQDKTVSLCRKINPDFVPAKSNNGAWMVGASVVIGVFAVIFYRLQQIEHEV